MVKTTGPADKPTLSGWAQLQSDGSVTGFAVFSLASGSNINEAVVPLETRNPGQFVVPFDNTSGYVSGVAIANVSANAASIPVTIRDDKGIKLTSDTIALAGRAHTAIIVPSGYTATANKRGTIQFDTPSGGQINALGLNFNPTLNFSSLPPEGIGSPTAAGSPTISSVTAILPQQTQTITITGTGFGTQAAYNGDSSFIEITDTTANWNAGFGNSTGANTVTLNVTSWTDTKIVIAGFTGDYGRGYTLTNGDKLEVKVWNVQTQTGPAIYQLTAGVAATTATGPSISTASLPGGTVGTAYGQLLSATGGTGSIVWSIAVGSLPNGITLSPAGVATGTPTAAGTFTFTIQATDTAGKSATKAFTIVVAAAGQSPVQFSCLDLKLGNFSKLSRPKMEPGMTVTLTWGSTCKTVTINPGFGTVASSGSVDLRPTQTTQYVLFFQDANGTSIQETQTLTVVPIATINSFTASPSTIALGGSSTLTWNTSNANYLAISPSGFTVPGSSLQGTSMGVSPTQTTTYTLSAVDLLETDPYVAPGIYPIGTPVTKQVTVTVGTATGGGSGSGTPGSSPGGSTPGGSGGGGTYTGTGTVVTPTLGGCVSSFFDPSFYNWEAYRNSCSVPVELLFFMTNGASRSCQAALRTGAYSIKANGVANGPNSKTDVANCGPEYLYVCPANYTPVDSAGNRVNNANTSYWCKAN